MNAQDRKWEAEDDFRSLVLAEQVRTNKGRFRRAKVAGRRIVRDETKALRVKRSISSSRSRSR